MDNIKKFSSNSNISYQSKNISYSNNSIYTSASNSSSVFYPNKDIDIFTISELEDTTNNISSSTKEAKEEKEITQTIQGEVNIENNDSSTTLTGYTVTSYYTGDGTGSSSTTGSGISTSEFSTTTIAGKNVYTYQGKIVVAAATKELLNSGYSKNGAQESQDKYYFSYYDTLKIKIDDTYYDAIVLDSCGAAMWDGEYRVDIFVPSASDVIDKREVSIEVDNNE